MVNTIYGEMLEEALMKRTGGHDDENETAEWVEYYHRETNELVHRSATVTLKKAGAVAAALQGTF
jgi:plasmid maintenance system antidote protein VapI